jgi:hypothetical protein
MYTQPSAIAGDGDQIEAVRVWIRSDPWIEVEQFLSLALDQPRPSRRLHRGHAGFLSQYKEPNPRNVLAPSFVLLEQIVERQHIGQRAVRRDGAVFRFCSQPYERKASLSKDISATPAACPPRLDTPLIFSCVGAMGPSLARDHALAVAAFHALGKLVLIMIGARTAGRLALHQRFATRKSDERAGLGLSQALRAFSSSSALA